MLGDVPMTISHRLVGNGEMGEFCLSVHECGRFVEDACLCPII